MNILFDNFNNDYDNQEDEYLDWIYAKEQISKLCPMIMQGNIGLWNGDFACGTIVEDFNDFIATAGKDCDYFKIEYDKEKVKILCPHHDGTNLYELKSLSQRGINKLASYENSDYCGFDECDRKFHELLFNQKGLTKLIRI